MTEHYTALKTNFAEGAYALYANESGHDNVAIGPYSLNRSIDGIDNVAVGPDALRYLTTGDDNTAFGNDAGRYIADGKTANSEADDCTYIGAGTRASASGVSNEIIIGAGAVGGGSNTARFGNEDITAWLPGDDGTVSLGSESAAFKELYLGAAKLDASAVGGFAPKVAPEFVSAVEDGPVASFNDAVISDAAWAPGESNVVTLGTEALAFKELYLSDGTDIWKITVSTEGALTATKVVVEPSEG